jgi:hypothetical protein
MTWLDKFCLILKEDTGLAHYKHHSKFQFVFDSFNLNICK